MQTAMLVHIPPAFILCDVGCFVIRHLRALQSWVEDRRERTSMLEQGLEALGHFAQSCNVAAVVVFNRV
jgi:hypothetical protein